MGEAARIKIAVLQGLHGNGVVLPCMMVYAGCSGSSTIGGLSALLTNRAGRRVAWRGVGVTHESYGWGLGLKAVLCSYLTSGCT